MTEVTTELPQAESADPDGVQVALRAAHTLWSNGETAESLRWLRRAAETASDEGADIRSLQLAKAAAELRAKLSRGSKAFGPDSVSPSTPSQSSPASVGSAESPLSERVVTATQYPSQRPPRSLMGISSATLERVMQRDSSAPPSALRGAVEEAKLPPEPPPLPLPDVFPASTPSSGLDAGWSAPKDEFAAALDPRTWSSELAEQEAQSRPSSARPPPMPRSSFRPPPLPELDDEEVDSDPEFLTEKSVEAAGHDARASGSAPRVADEFAPDDWRLAPPHRETSNGAGFGFESAEVEPAQFSGHPASAPPPSSIERPVSDFGFGSGSPSGLDLRPGTDAERSASAQPLSARVHHQAVRVALAPDPRTPGHFILRALRERELPHNGERVALLVALEPGTPLV
jgi:hypothetical protein